MLKRLSKIAGPAFALSAAAALFLALSGCPNPESPEAKSSDATLKSLSVSPGTLVPGFDPATLAYTVEADSGTSSVAITAVANHGGAKLSGGGAHSLQEGANPIEIVVTAEDETSSKTYTVTVNRAKAPSEGAPVSGDALDLTALIGAPVKGAAPLAAAIDADQYTGTMEWQTGDGAVFTGEAFAPATVYRAALTLTAKTGYTFAGLGADSFVHTGAASVANAADSGAVTIVFPATAAIEAVSALDLSGLITAPVKDAAPVTTAIDAPQYAGTILWQTGDGAAFSGAAFAPATVYKAVVSLTAKPGYTLSGVAADSFVYAGATASNAADSGVVGILFPATAEAGAGAAKISALNLSSLVAAPVKGAAPATSLEAGQYTGAIAWQTGDGAPFAGAAFASFAVYKAVVTLTPKTGYTLTGVGANSFTCAGATSTTNAADSGVVTISFPATAPAVVDALDLSALITAPVKDAAPVATAIDTAQYRGTIVWQTSTGASFSEAAFAPATVYRAVATLTAKPGYTLTGVGANSFVHTGAASASNAANSGVVTIVFPATVDAVVSSLDLTGLVTAPVKGAAPDTAAINTGQYTGTIAWQTEGGAAFEGPVFDVSTVYKGVITLTAKPGYTLAGVGANSFAYTGATASNAVNSGVVTIVFPATTAVEVVNATDLSSRITAPVKGATPAATISHAQYTGTVAWQTGDGAAFGGPVFAVSTVYKAVITLTARTGYTLTGLGADTFTYDGSTSIANAADSGVITIDFPATAAVETVNALDLSGLVTAPAKLAAPAATSINVSQYTGTIQWQNDDGTAFTGAAFDVSTVYKAVVTLTAKVGYHLTGVAANSFIYDGATVTNAEDSGVVTITFPATADATVVNALNLTDLVTAPVKLTAPQTANINTSQYTGTIQWQNNDETPFAGPVFAPATVYKAVVTLTAKPDYTFAGVGANSFTYVYTGATTINAVNSGEVTITFPTTAPAELVDALDLTALITAPVKDAVPDTMAIDENQYTGTIAWQTEDSAPFTGPAFAPVTVYKAVATLTAKLGYTFAGLEADSFVHTGAATISNAADSGTVTITFPATAVDIAALTRTMITVPAGTVSEEKAWGASIRYPLPQTFPAFKIGATEVVYDLWYEVYQWATSSDRGENIYTFAYPGWEGNQSAAGAAPSARKYEPATCVHWRGAVVWCNAYTEWSNATQGTNLTPVYYEDEGYATILRVADAKSPYNQGKAEKAFLKPGANGYRLPTEREWEYAARGADPDAAAWLYTYAGSNTIDDVAWYRANSGKTTHEVAAKAPNTLGLYDMIGNVSEFCQDLFGGTTLVVRGNTWDENKLNAMTVHTRGNYSLMSTSFNGTVGFRVAASLSD